MFGRRNFVTAVLVIYLVLIILFFAYKESSSYSSGCIYGSSCVRFCCDDHDTCSNKFINTHFNASLIPEEEDSEKENDVKYLFGRPDCSTLKSFAADRQWKFDYNGALEQKENATGDYFYYDFDEYCLEAIKSSGNDVIEWEVHHCENQGNAHATMHVYLLTASVSVIVAAIVVFFSSRSLQTAAARCELMFLIGIFLIYFCYTWAYHGRNTFEEILLCLLIGGILWTYFWTSVLTFDIWWSFRYQEATQNEAKKFRQYFYSVLGAIATFIIVAFATESGQRNFRFFMKFVLMALFVCYFLMAIVDIILLLLTGYMVFQLSKATRSTDHARYEAEKERFWKYLGIYFIMLITWPIEIYSMHFYSSAASRNIADIIQLFSTIVIFAVFAWKKLLGIFRHYDTLDNSLL